MDPLVDPMICISGQRGPACVVVSNNGLNKPITTFLIKIVIVHTSTLEFVGQLTDQRQMCQNQRLAGRKISFGATPAKVVYFLGRKFRIRVFNFCAVHTDNLPFGKEISKYYTYLEICNYTIPQRKANFKYFFQKEIKSTQWRKVDFKEIKGLGVYAHTHWAYVCIIYIYTAYLKC